MESDLSTSWRRPALALVASVAVIVPLGLTSAVANAVSASPVVINEIESNGDANDWVELKNTGPAAVDVSGWIVHDNDDSHAIAIPDSTTIMAGGYFSINTDDSTIPGEFGLGGADSARLFDGATLIDSYSWTAHATTTYGRSPDGTGAFTTTSASTKNAANSFATPTATQWPGGQAVDTVDTAGFFGANLSGLDFETTPAGDALWAVKNGPGTLYRLVKNGESWQADSGDWAAGKALHYPDGTGNPDSEAVTFTDAGSSAGLFVATERNNDASTTSRPSILKIAPDAAGSSLTATHEWNLTADLPTVGPNLGLEAITWIPDSALVAQGFFDEKTSALYDPSTYPGHGDGLFFVGLEANGAVYAYALDQSSGDFDRIATFASGFPSIMELQWDAETNHLWVDCDNTCAGRMATLDIAQSGGDDGRFVVSNTFATPTGLPNVNNEGFAVAPNALCVDNAKPVFWADDDQTDGHAVREGTINCPTLADAPTPTETPTPTPTPTTTETATPAPTATPTLVPTPATISLHAPVVAGAASVGSTLTAKIVVSPSTAKLSYQWLRNGSAISGATSSRYKIVSADAARRVAVRITVLVPGASPVNITSTATDRVVKVFSKPLKTAITGKAKVGKTLKAHTNRVSPRPSVSYRWYANGKPIAKATKSSLAVTKSLTGKKITVKATATRSGYKTVGATSKATSKVK
jgi:hypothetical protein